MTGAPALDSHPVAFLHMTVAWKSYNPLFAVTACSHFYGGDLARIEQYGHCHPEDRRF